MENATGILKVSTQEAGEYLNELVEMGYLEYVEKERKSIYRLK